MAEQIIFEELSFQYFRALTPALKNISISINDGEYVTIMGGGGSGKSSLCYTLNGSIPNLLRGTYRGNLIINGLKVSDQKVWEMSKHVGMVLQDFETQLLTSSVDLELAFGLENLRLPKQTIQERILKYATAFDLKNMLSHEPTSLSGGQKQKLAIASVLCMESGIVVMDEPTTDLDPISQDFIIEIARQLRREKKTVLISDHHPEFAMHADRLILLKDGEIIQEGRPSEILLNTNLLRECRIMPLPLIEFMGKLGFEPKLWTTTDAIESLPKKFPKLTSKLYFRQERLRKHKNYNDYALPIIKTQELTHVYEYRKLAAVKNANLSIYEGEFISVIGPNGSGKSTLAKHFNGLLKPSSGIVQIKGRDINDYSRKELASIVGYVFQNPDHQIFSPSVFEEAGFSLKQFGYSDKQIEERVDKALGVVGLAQLKEADPVKLTKGQRQRLAIASAIVTEPEILVLDEPTKGLDYLHKIELMQLLTHLNNNGHTIILITHSLAMVAEYAHRILILNAGEVKYDGPIDQAFRDQQLIRNTGLNLPDLFKVRNQYSLNGLTIDELVTEINEL